MTTRNTASIIANKEAAPRFRASYRGGTAHMDYHEMRRPFEPTTVKLVLLAESPPAPNKRGESKYFYNPTGSARESLFEATMKALGIDCGGDKEKGLHELRRRGVLLLDMS